MGVRKEQKLATRRKVLAAARDLFDQTGYDATTVRAIAQRAGVSVGSVFTTFSSKAELLAEIMVDRLEELHGRIETQAAQLEGNIHQRLSRLARMFYDFELSRPNLYLAYVRNAFSPDLPAGLNRFGSPARVTELSRKVLHDGVARGELRHDLDLDLMLTAMSAYYLWTYRHLAMDGADIDSLSSRYDSLLAQLLDGASCR